MTRQLTFDLPPRAAYGRDDFFVSASNASALASMDAWRDWPSGKMVLIGPSGAGKTHLAHIWAAQSASTIISADALESADISDLAAKGPVAVEDCQDIGGTAAAEEALFHLHNLLAEHRAALLLTATCPPRDWGLNLPDLSSRMQAMSLTRLDAPDDALLSALLIKLFDDRQLAVSPALIPFLVTRMDRSFAAAHALVADLDAEALARGTAVTRQLAASLLDKG